MEKAGRLILKAESGRWITCTNSELQIPL